jgi:hypothetical protein
MDDVNLNAKAENEKKKREPCPHQKVLPYRDSFFRPSPGRYFIYSDSDNTVFTKHKIFWFRLLF